MRITTASAPQSPAHVLMVFGITVDLTNVMTCRTLDRLESCGLLTCRVTS